MQPPWGRTKVSPHATYNAGSKAPGRRRRRVARHNAAPGFAESRNPWGASPGFPGCWSNCRSSYGPSTTRERSAQEWVKRCGHSEWKLASLRLLSGRQSPLGETEKENGSNSQTSNQPRNRVGLLNLYAMPERKSSTTFKKDLHLPEVRLDLEGAVGQRNLAIIAEEVRRFLLHDAQHLVGELADFGFRRAMPAHL